MLLNWQSKGTLSWGALWLLIAAFKWSPVLLALVMPLSSRPASLLQALVAEEAAAAAEQQRAADEAARRLQLQAEKAALVGPELPADSALPHASLVFRLPDGSRLSRRFGLDAAVQQLYDFLDSKVRRSTRRQLQSRDAGAPVLHCW